MSKIFIFASLLLLSISSLLIIVVASVSATSSASSSSSTVRHHLDQIVKHESHKKNIKPKRGNSMSNDNKHSTLQKIVKNPDIIEVIKAKSDNCTACSNGEDCCPDGPGTTSTCCGGGSFCCDNNATCCQDTCCSEYTQSCCPDPKNGGVCCESELTQCCSPEPEYDLPSRCCPNWYVCCPLGKYGCCDPDTGLAFEGSSSPSENIARALFLEPIWISGNMKFDAATIGLNSGNYTQTRVSDFQTWGETQRSFMYDRNRDVFYLLQANFTAPSPSGGGNDPQRAIHLFTVNPTTGVTTKTLVTGADDLVTGYHFVPEQDTIVMATVYYTSASKTEAGFKFFHLDPKTSHATFVTEHKTAVNPSTSAGKYDGWFHEVTPDLKYALRLGFEDIETQSNWGIGISDLTQNPVRTTWMTLPFPPDHNSFQTLTMIDSASPTVRAHFPELVNNNNNKNSYENGAPINENLFFLSLAGSDNSSRYNDLDLFLWPLQNPSQMKQVAKFQNAHKTPDFGPIEEAVNADGTQYAALVVCDSPLSNNDDVWCLATADVSSKSSSSSFNEYELNPVLLAETVSAAGIGIPENQQEKKKKKHQP